jgi:predicted aspartyl protease
VQPAKEYVSCTVNDEERAVRDEFMGRRGFLRAAGVTAGAAAVLGPAGADRAFAARAGGPAAVGPDQLFQDGLFAAADEGYAAVLRKDPRDAHAWAQRGYIALLSNRFADTERFLGRAIELAPGDQASMGRLADCYVRQDYFARAVPLLQRSGDRTGAALYGAVTGEPYEISGTGEARIPFLTLDPLPTVSASVNGRQARFVLDTGATFGLSAAMAKEAGVRVVATVMVLSPSGPVPGYIGVVDSLRLGGIEVRNVPVMWEEASLVDAPGDAVGVLGTTIFYHFLTTMDYAGRELRLGPRKAGTAGPAAVPMWLAPDHFVFARGTIGHSGQGLVLLDTGGTGLGVVLTRTQAAQAGIAPDLGKPGTYLGVPGYPCTAARITLGPVARSDIPGAVGPYRPPADFGFGDLGTLSHEFFKPLSVTFDFTAMTLDLS